MHIIEPIGMTTRRIQSAFPKRPVRGMSRLGNLIDRFLPTYKGIVTMNPGFQMCLNTDMDAAMGLFLSGLYQPALTYVLLQHRVPGGYYLDVGANLGFFTLLFASWASEDGKVAAFEANPHMVKRVAEGCRLNNFDVEIVEKAIHVTAGETISFFVSASPGKSSIYSHKLDDVAQEITVTTTTIDTFIQRQMWSRVDMIKMDIEGNDCHGLLGAAETINQHRPFIVFEYWHDTPVNIRNAVSKLFADAGYHLEILHMNGKREAFNWSVPMSREHVDVLCFPRKS